METKKEHRYGSILIEEKELENEAIFQVIISNKRGKYYFWLFPPDYQVKRITQVLIFVLCIGIFIGVPSLVMRFYPQDYSDSPPWYVLTPLSAFLGAITALMIVVFEFLRNEIVSYSYPANTNYRDAKDLSIVEWGPVPPELQLQMFFILHAFYRNLGVFPLGGVSFTGKIEKHFQVMTFVIGFVFVAAGVVPFSFGIVAIDQVTYIAGLIGILFGSTSIICGLVILRRGIKLQKTLKTKSLEICFIQDWRGNVDGYVKKRKENHN